MLRVAFAGTPDFAVPTLRALADSPHALVGVLTQPDRPAGRGRELTASAVKRLALELKLPLAQPATLQDPETLSLLGHWAPDALVVVAYGLMLPPAVLARPRLGGINIHASLLPRWRGAAPIQRAILAGDTETGITIMQIDTGLDTGAILAQQRVPIQAATNSQQLHDQLAQLGADVLLATLQLAEGGLLRPKAQPDQGVSYASKIDKAEARIDWWRSATEIERQVRAFNPRPVAETQWQGQQLRVWQAQPACDTRAAGAHDDFPQPGNILGLAHEQLLVQCGQGRLALTKLQLAGRRIVTAREFASAQSLAGSRFG
ncbi:MAG TPA: methionyl-tRNA formyltransferase [Steroidobacteraceae bacterium]|jgi:methionyl-tRNA formyltransferase|nr:methionyl-tRNA formyltransferase [Steroidobacteraceae bacterium]